MKNVNLLGVSESSRLHSDILYLMLKGAGYAAILVGGCILFVYIFIGIGALLPPESKEAEDPTPQGAALSVVHDIRVS